MIMCSFLVVYMYQYALTSVGSRNILYGYCTQWGSFSIWHLVSSDRRLADHFGGKLHLGYMQIRDKLAELQVDFFVIAVLLSVCLSRLFSCLNLVLHVYLIINKMHPKVSQWLLPYFCLHLSFHHKISLKFKLSTCLSGAGYNVSLLALESKRLFLALSEFF